ncbi:MAG: hypothetical protein Q8O12_04335 [Candidatus Omnitrophota bacterium]|nr:hypothetical protein [Candidatus Omnitrophota bacterium]
MRNSNFKKKVYIKLISLVLIQVFLTTGIVYPDNAKSLRPVMMGSKQAGEEISNERAKDAKDSTGLKKSGPTWFQNTLYQSFQEKGMLFRKIARPLGLNATGIKMLEDSSAISFFNLLGSYAKQRSEWLQWLDIVATHELVAAIGEKEVRKIINEFIDWHLIKSEGFWKSLKSVLEWFENGEINSASYSQGLTYKCAIKLEDIDNAIEKGALDTAMANIKFDGTNADLLDYYISCYAVMRVARSIGKYKRENLLTSIFPYVEKILPRFAEIELARDAVTAVLAAVSDYGDGSYITVMKKYLPVFYQHLGMPEANDAIIAVGRGFAKFGTPEDIKFYMKVLNENLKADNATKLIPYVLYNFVSDLVEFQRSEAAGIVLSMGFLNQSDADHIPLSGVIVYEKTEQEQALDMMALVRDTFDNQIKQPDLGYADEIIVDVSLAVGEFFQDPFRHSSRGPIKIEYSLAPGRIEIVTVNLSNKPVKSVKEIVEDESDPANLLRPEHRGIWTINTLVNRHRTGADDDFIIESLKISEGVYKITTTLRMRTTDAQNLLNEVKSPKLFLEIDGRQKFDTKVFRFLIKLAADDIAREHGIHVASALIGSAVYLSQDGLVDVDAISDIDVVLEAYDSAGRKDIYRLFINALYERMKSSGAIDNLSWIIYDNRPALALSVPQKKEALPIFWPIIRDDIPWFFIGSLLEQDYIKEKPERRHLAILYYAGTFFHEDSWFRDIRDTYLYVVDKDASALKGFESRLEREANSVRRAYKELKKGSMQHKAFIAHVRKMIGLPDKPYASKGILNPASLFDILSRKTSASF